MPHVFGQPGLLRLRHLLIGAVKASTEAISSAVGCTSSTASLLRLQHIQNVEEWGTSTSNASSSSFGRSGDRSGSRPATSARGSGQAAKGSLALPALPSRPHAATFATIALQMAPGEGLLAARRLRSEPEPFEDEYNDDEYEDGEYVDLDVEDLLADLADLDEIDLDRDDGEWEVSDDADEAEEGEVQQQLPPPPSARPRKDWRS